jgi:hypothetical protein
MICNYQVRCFSYLCASFTILLQLLCWLILVGVMPILLLT